MLDEVNNLPDDPSVLKELIASMASELTNRDAELKSRDILIEKLKHQLSGLRRQQFGSRSESLDQLELTLEQEEIARATETPATPACGYLDTVSHASFCRIACCASFSPCNGA